MNVSMHPITPVTFAGKPVHAETKTSLAGLSQRVSDLIEKHAKGPNKDTLATEHVNALEKVVQAAERDLEQPSRAGIAWRRFKKGARTYTTGWVSDRAGKAFNWSQKAVGAFDAFLWGLGITAAHLVFIPPTHKLSNDVYRDGIDTQGELMELVNDIKDNPFEDGSILSLDTLKNGAIQLTISNPDKNNE